MQIMSSWPHFDKEEIEATGNILAEGKVNYRTGIQGRLFEEEFASWSGTKKAIAIGNGSLALAAAYKAIGLKEKDEVITTPRTFIATAAEIALRGAKPVFADVDQDTGLITADTIKPLINKNTKAISVVHLAGWPADMKDIVTLAKKNNLYVIEDCAQAHGAQIDNISVGSFGDIGAWSFCQDKIMSTGGEGGMITTNNIGIFNNINSYKDHGKNLEYKEDKSLNNPGYKFIHEGLGTNFRMTEMQSAIGRIQLKKLKEWSILREKNAFMLRSILSKSHLVRIPEPKDGIKHAWYKFYAYIKPSNLRSDWSRDRIILEINELGAPAFSGSCGELYLEKCMSSFYTKRLKNAKFLSDNSLMFLVDQTISISNMEKYGEIVLSVLKRACN